MSMSLPLSRRSYTLNIPYFYSEPAPGFRRVNRGNALQSSKALARPGLCSIGPEVIHGLEVVRCARVSPTMLERRRRRPRRAALYRARRSASRDIATPATRGDAHMSPNAGAAARRRSPSLLACLALPRCTLLCGMVREARGKGERGDGRGSRRGRGRKGDGKSTGGGRGGRGVGAVEGGRARGGDGAGTRRGRGGGEAGGGIGAARQIEGDGEGRLDDGREEERRTRGEVIGKGNWLDTRCPARLHAALQLYILSSVPETSDTGDSPWSCNQGDSVK
ncbi:hypothetical protein BD626DRAFT_581427 [Schizophyllum amplum]|uniref:Uncharacterized protein n=1 Tax=Schizophyllum amplum TaxID=97359 RepID=A0A550CNT5_9AGAR|nr:hypothetical protein BD626DRAFT_581427 [Auriculariopsis ampla]